MDHLLNPPILMLIPIPLYSHETRHSFHHFGSSISGLSQASTLVLRFWVRAGYRSQDLDLRVYGFLFLKYGLQRSCYSRWAMILLSVTLAGTRF